MNKKKEVFIIIIATVLTFGVPIQTWADSNDSLVSNDVVFFDERDSEHQVRTSRVDGTASRGCDGCKCAGEIRNAKWYY